MDEKSERNVSIANDIDGSSIVIINDIRFRGKAWDEWDEIEEYPKQYVGECYEILETSEVIYVGNDFPDEYVGSEYTAHLWKEEKRAKANAIQGIPEIIRIAGCKKIVTNEKDKHLKDAYLGWAIYKTKFALPKYVQQFGEYKHVGYKLYYADLLVRTESNGTLWLYDIIHITKKKA
ncbi:MAG: hypothetical protein IKW92_04245 [Firmicutes bacterium]|nr:hypothetical protein [Bacillota bacterium]